MKQSFFSVILTNLLLICVKQCEGHSDLVSDIHQNSPKMWQAYVHKFVARFLQHPFSALNHKTLVKDLTTYSNIFTALKYKHTWKLLFTLSYSRKFSWGTRTVNCVSGRLFLYSKARRPDMYTFYYQPHKSLKVNFTFHTMLILNGTLFVISGKYREFRKGAPDSDLFFSGHHSLVFVYPKFQSFYLQPIPNYHLVFIVNGTFAVMGTNLVHSLPVQTFQNLKPNQMFAIEDKNQTLVTYHLQTEKLNQIVLTMSLQENYNYIVYDGPGILSNMLRKLPIQKCSTFQCFIHLLTASKSANSDNYFIYESCQLPIHQSNTTVHKTRKTYFPNENCTSHLCVAGFTTDSDHQINLTVSNLTVQGNFFDVFPACVLSGVIVGEYLNKAYREYQTHCEAHDSGYIQRQRLYSHNSSLMLLVYWYKNYNKIDVSVITSQTNCQPIVINLCHFHKECIRYRSYCRNFLYIITEYADIVVSYSKPVSRTVDPYLFFEGWNETCVILILFRPVSVAVGCFVGENAIAIEMQSSQIQVIRALTSPKQTTMRSVMPFGPKASHSKVLTSDLIHKPLEKLPVMNTSFIYVPLNTFGVEIIATCPVRYKAMGLIEKHHSLTDSRVNCEVEYLCRNYPMPANQITRSQLGADHVVALHISGIRDKYFWLALEFQTDKICCNEEHVSQGEVFHFRQVYCVL